SGAASSASSFMSGRASVSRAVMSVLPEVGRRDDVPLDDLAGRILRQLVDDPDPPRVLVRGDLGLGVITQLVHAGGGSRLEDDRGADLLAQVRVGHPDDGD